MTPSDAQRIAISDGNRIERLIKQLRKDARLFPSMESIRKAADEIERLRGVEEKIRKTPDWHEHGALDPAWLLDQIVHALPIKRDWLDPNLEAAARVTIQIAKEHAASRSTGAADVGEEHE